MERNNNHFVSEKPHSSIKDNCCNTETMKYDCGICAPFMEGSEEVSSIHDDKSKNMISQPSDIVKVESLVASLSKLDCIVEEKKTEEMESEMGETRDEPVETEETTAGTTVGIVETTVDTEPPVTEVAETTTGVISEQELVSNETSAVVEEPIVETTLECDFDKNPTDLYLCLMRKDWSGSIRRCVQRPEEAKTWIYRKEATGTLRWKLLPIHAGIIFSAPVPVIDALLHAYLYGADCKDDQGMVPLHLAIRMNSDHTIVEKLVSARPTSVKAQDRKGRTPRALAEKQEACPQKLLVIQTLDNVNTTTISPSNAAPQRTMVSPSASRSVTLNTNIDALAPVSTTPKVEAQVIPKVFSAEEVEGVKHIFEMQLEKSEREGTVMQNTLKQKIEVLENNSKRDAETIRTLEEKVLAADTTESELQSRITELETALQNTITEKTNSEDSNKAVIVNLVSQVGGIQAKLTSMSQERDTVATTLAELEETSKQEIAHRKLRVLELERQLGQVTYIKEETEESLNKAEQTLAKQLGQMNLLKEDMAKLQSKLTETEIKLEEVTVSEQELAWQNHALSVTGQMYAKNSSGHSDPSGRSTEYLNQIKSLEKEREELRETVNKLSVKLYKVVGFLDEMVEEQEAIITETMTRDSEMVAEHQLPPTTTYITNTDGSVQPVPVIAAISEDRMKLLSNVSGMKEQIIGVIDSVIEGMPEELEEDSDNLANQVLCTPTTPEREKVEAPVVVLP